MGAALKISRSDVSAIARGDFHAPRWSDYLEEKRVSVEAAKVLSPRWYPLIPHPEQLRMIRSPARFKICAAGRRSGKTERVKRQLVKEAIGPQKFDDGLYVAAAPTRMQAKRIYWEDLKALVPRSARDITRGKNGVSETELTIFLPNQARLMVVGLDNFAALEGVSVDLIVLDEYATMKPEAWRQTVRPLLSQIGRPGRAWFVGRPRGRNHFYTLVKEFGINPERAEWDYFHWMSEDILDPVEIAQAKDDLDEISFAQEYRAEFVTFEGRIYYEFQREVHSSLPIRYDPAQPLALCFDFNVEPGVCAILQEQYREPIAGTDYWLGLDYDGRRYEFDPNFTACVGEVWIPKSSNTPAVCRKIVQDWSHHQGEFLIYGDATGGARGTAKVHGSDWDIIKNELGEAFGRDRVKDRVKRKNPPERARVNAVNKRLRAANGRVRFLIDPKRAPHVANDLEDVVAVEGGAFEIEKDKDDDLTHISDALGYYIERKFPARAYGGISTAPIA